MPIQFWSKGTEEYRYLSNFYRAPFAYDKQWWPTAEHLYQAMKYEDREVQEAIRQLATPQEAKKYAEQHLDGKCHGWYNRKRQTMEFILTLKFYQNPQLCNQLISIEEDLVHYAPWDDYWGAGKDGKGENVLGEILMELRDKIRAWE
jgi:ribA/ribD-fused uncharacterized protein